MLEDNALAGAFVVLILHLWLYFLPQQGLQWQLRPLPVASPLQLTQHSTAHLAPSRDSPSRKLSDRERFKNKACLAPAYKQLKTLAFRLWCKLPGHWNDFTIPDNDGPAQRQTRLGSDFLRPLRGEFQKDQTFPIMNLMGLHSGPHLFFPCR